MSSQDDTERPRGCLSTADREYLLGERTYSSEQAERNTRARIRKRLYHTLLDFNLALETLSDRDRRQLFSLSDSNPELPTGLLGAIGFIYRGVTESGGPNFEQILYEGINRAEAKRGYLAELDIDLQRRPLEFDDVRQRMEAGEELPGTILTEMLQEGAIDIEDLEEYLDERGDAEVDDTPE